MKTALRRQVLHSYFSGYAWNKLFSMKTIREAGLLFDEEPAILQDLHQHKSVLLFGAHHQNIMTVEE